MPVLEKGRYRVRTAAGGEVDRALALRALAFRGGADGGEGDAFDARCRHLLVEEAPTGDLVATFRLLPLPSGADLGQSYSAQYYDLSALAAYPGRMIELGRFCLHPDRHDPDILRLAWGAITQAVDAEGAGLLFGCSSFKGTDAREFRDAFALLGERHLAPKCWRPRVKAPRVFRFGRRRAGGVTDVRQALLRMPPLLRTYLAMGGWVSDHAVVDAELGTLHVFTGLEIGQIPPARAKALRLVAG